jgi:NAD(P)-dependent dehydrogenase (short-subunit alcohol dehydrogenase family)
MKNFDNKVAVITGGASGLGREFANTAAGLGMKLVLADVQQDMLDQARPNSRGRAPQVLAMLCDVRKGDQVQALADATMARFGAVHLLFNNAGVGSGGLIWENSEADWEWVMGVNVWGVIHGVRIFTKLMLECAKADPAYEGPYRQHGLDGGLAQCADDGRLQRVQARGGVAVGNPVPRPAAGGSADRGLGAVPVLCADRHQPVAPQPSGRCEAMTEGPTTSQRWRRR